MDIYLYKDADALGKAAAIRSAELINAAIAKGEANVILATGASQFTTLEHLVNEDVDWSKVTMFHLDEYVGMDTSHPASFCKYLQERFVDKVEGLKEAVLIRGDAANIDVEIKRVSDLIASRSIDVALVGIGENGHLAFNDPPADFETEAPYLVVELDEDCRKQQLGEGWFGSLDEVPTEAVSMGIKRIMQSRHLIVAVPDQRKAQAVKSSLEGAVTNLCPSSILQEHESCSLFLDETSASLLEM